MTANGAINGSVSSDYPDEEVDHKEDIEREVDLLRGAVCPLLTRLNRLSVNTPKYTLRLKYSATMQAQERKVIYIPHGDAKRVGLPVLCRNNSVTLRAVCLNYYFHIHFRHVTAPDKLSYAITILLSELDHHHLYQVTYQVRPHLD